MIMKLENQAGHGRYPGVLRAVNDGTLQSVDDVKDRINAMLPNRVLNGEERADYIESGVEHAMTGTEVFNRLRAAATANPLRSAFATVTADPPARKLPLRNEATNPTQSPRSSLGTKMFLQNTTSPPP